MVSGILLASWAVSFFFDRISIEHTKCPLKKFCIKRVCYIGRFGLSEALLREVCFIERFVDV